MERRALFPLRSVSKVFLSSAMLLLITDPVAMGKVYHIHVFLSIQREFVHKMGQIHSILPILSEFRPFIARYLPHDDFPGRLVPALGQQGDWKVVGIRRLTGNRPVAVPYEHPFAVHFGCKPHSAADAVWIYGAARGEVP